jgi:hypothetical protein
MFVWPSNEVKMVVDGFDYGLSLPIVTRGAFPLRDSFIGGHLSWISGFVKGFFVVGDTCFWVVKLIGYSIAMVVVRQNLFYNTGNSHHC